MQQHCRRCCSVWHVPALLQVGDRHVDGLGGALNVVGENLKGDAHVGEQAAKREQRSALDGLCGAEGAQTHRLRSRRRDSEEPVLNGPPCPTHARTCS
jgi:hypothetical protein